MRPSRHTILCAAGLLALGGAAGCAGVGGPAKIPATAEITPLAASEADDLGTMIVPADTPSPSGPPTARIVTPEATTTVSVTLQTVLFDPALDVRPGLWAPDGNALVAFVVTEEDKRGPIGHLWTVDATSASPQWDSGDIEELIRMPVAEWLPDSTLVLARAADMKVRADGTPAGDVAGIDGQVRYIDVSPDGQTIFAVGPDGAWLVGADGNARRVQADDEPGFANWYGLAWRPDSSALAVNQSAEKYYTIDATSAMARLAGETPELMQIDLTAPLWLGDDWVWFPQLDHVVNVETTATQSPEEIYGVSVATNDRRPINWRQLSPDRRYALYNDVPIAPTAEAPGTAYPQPDSAQLPRATTILDRSQGASRPIEPIFPDATWSPTSDRYAVLNAHGLAVHAADADKKSLVVAPERNAQHFQWSPDGKWITFYDIHGDLWLVGSDGSAGPVRVLQGPAAFWQPITWSPAGDRFAVAAPDADVVEAAEAGAEATNAAAPAGSTEVPMIFPDVPASLVLVTIQGAGGPEQP